MDENLIMSYAQQLAEHYDKQECADLDHKECGVIAGFLRQLLNTEPPHETTPSPSLREAMDRVQSAFFDHTEANECGCCYGKSAFQLCSQCALRNAIDALDHTISTPKTPDPGSEPLEDADAEVEAQSLADEWLMIFDKEIESRGVDAMLRFLWFVTDKLQRRLAVKAAEPNQ